MKKRLLLILAGVMITGCSSASSSKSTVSKMLKSLRQGFKLEGEIKQNCQYLTGSTSAGGKINGKTASNTYKQEIIFENSTEKCYSTKLYQEVESENESGETITEDSLVYETSMFEGEDGYAYYYDMDINNTIVKRSMKDSSNLSLNYGYYYSNPFELILEDDLTKIDNNTYSLAKNKASFAASILFGIADDAFYGVIDSFILNVEGSTLKSIEVKPAQLETSSTDYETYSQVYYLLDNVATFDVSEISTAKIYKPTVREHTSDHDRLQTAIDKIGTNFTLTRELHSYINGVEGDTETLVLYYDGTNIYYKAVVEGFENTIDSSNDVLVYQKEGETTLTAYGYDDASLTFTESAGSSFSQLNGYTYDVYLPVFNGVAAEIFDKTGDNQYSICDDMKTYIGALAFVPPMGSVEYLDGYGTGCDISLTDDDSIDMIQFSYEYGSSLYSDIGTVDIYIDNVGTTVIPFDALNKIA